jgi:molybdopterin-containing oxidoreductase family membrane subunit
LPGRVFWLTALTAPKFLASAFATGPALLILLCFLLKRLTGFDVGKQAVRRLAVILTYSVIITLFMVAVEFFTAFFSQSPGHMVALQYLFFGIHGHATYTVLLWLFVILSVAAVYLLLNGRARKSDTALCVASAFIFLAMLIEKGIAFVIGGFMNNPFHRIAEYSPTLTELSIAAGIWAVGALIISLLYKVAVFVKSGNRYGCLNIQQQHEMRG